MIDLATGRLPTIDRDRLYSICELANLLRVSPRSVDRYRRTGVPIGQGEMLRLPAIRVAKVWRVRGGDVLDWLAAQQPRPAPTRASEVSHTGHHRRLVDKQLDALGL